MPHSHTAHFRIRHSELNTVEEMPNRALAHLLQETAMDASAAAGYGLRWYEQHQTVWVIREMTLEHLRPIHYQDELDITTWLFDMQRVRARREYAVHNTQTGELVARASAYWGYISRATLMPTRIPPEVFPQFEPSGIRAVPRARPRVYPPPRVPLELHAERRVQHYEADAMGHVNNGIYLDWFEEPLYRLTPAGRRLCVRRHDVEYVRGALPGDELELVTRLQGVGNAVTAWALEITRAGDTIARDRILAYWVDEGPAGKSTAGSRPVRCRIGG